MAGVAGPVEQVDLGHRLDRVRQAIDHVEPPSLGHVRDGLDEHADDANASQHGDETPNKRDVASRVDSPRRDVPLRPACCGIPTSSSCGRPRPSASSAPRSACSPSRSWPCILLGATPFEVALLGTIEFLPFILFSLPAGAWVDRLRRRPILIVGDLGRAASLASIPIAYALGVLTIWQLYVVGFINGTLTVFFDVAYKSYLPSLVDRDQLVDGNGKLEISRTVAQTAGPALGGGLIGLVTAPIADRGRRGQLPRVGALRLPHPPRGADAGSARRRARPAAHRACARRSRRACATCWATAYLRGIAASHRDIEPVQQRSRSRPSSSTSCATWAFARGDRDRLRPRQHRVAGRRADREPRRRTARRRTDDRRLDVPRRSRHCCSSRSRPKAFPIPFLVASGFLFGLSAVIYNINQVSFRQAITPAPMQGRMNATMRFIVWGTIPIGAILGGIIATTVGVHEAIWIGAAGSILAVVPLLITPVRTLRVMPAPVDDEPARRRDGLRRRRTADIRAPARQPDRSAGSLTAGGIGTWTPRSRATSIARS